MSRPIALFIILILTVTCYWQALFFDFLNWDDPAHFLDNPHIFSLSSGNIINIFRTTVLEIYIPLTVLSYAVEYHFYAFNPMISHFHNILLHLGVTILIFFFSCQCGLTRNASLIAALIFGVHPMHVESVAWITERKDVLYAFLYMASIYSYCSYLKHKNLSIYGLSLLCGLLSILAKPMALSLPLVLFVCDWIHKRKFSIKSLADKIPFFLYSIAIAWITFASVQGRIPAKDIGKGLLVCLWTFSFYISKFIFPVHLVPIYAVPEPVHIGNPAFLYSLLLIVILAGILFMWKQRRWYIFALLLYVFQIFFLLRFNDKIGVHVVADRFMYLPSLGFCLLFGYLLDRLAGTPDVQASTWRRRASKAVVIVYLSSLSVMTLFQVRIWQNDITLWSALIRDNPHEYIAYHNRGHALMKKGQDDLALLNFQKSLQLNPGKSQSYNNRGMIFTRRKEFQKALQEFEKALAINPESDAVFINRGNLYRVEGKLSEAIKEYDRVLRHEDPNPLMLALAYAEKGYTLYLLKDYPAARNHVNRALTIFPDLDIALEYQGMIDRKY